MDWSLAIQRNRSALLAIVAAIAALVGRKGGAIPCRLRSAALALLRPAESAARRLIVIAARGLAVALGPPCAPVLAPIARAAAPDRPPAFPLFDRRMRFKLTLPRPEPRGLPRIRSFWGPPMVAPPVQPVPPPAARPRPDPDAPVDAARLRLRLASLEAALADLPRQARRLVRWRARRAALSRPCRPLRIGHPPGHRRRPDRDIDNVLRDCHALALDALRLDTS